MATQFYYSVPGILGPYPWISKADTKYKDGGLFHGTHIAEANQETEDLKNFLTKAAEISLADQITKVARKDQHDWTVYLPFEDERDQEGNLTGRTVFSFAQNQTLKLKDGTIKVIHIAVYDAEDNLLTKKVTSPEGLVTYENPAIFQGTLGVFKYSVRPIVIVGSQKAGVRLDFAAYQLIKAAGLEEHGGFGKREGYASAQGEVPADEDSPY